MSGKHLMCLYSEFHSELSDGPVCVNAEGVHLTRKTNILDLANTHDTSDV